MTRRAEFLRCAAGVRAAKPGVVIQTIESPEAGEGLRVGFTASKKVGDAVVRNRAKRRLREAARALLPDLGRPGHDYVFVARAATPQRAWTALLDDVRSALIRLAPAAPARPGDDADG